MNRRAIIIIGGAILLIVVFAMSQPTDPISIVPHGYDGPAASMDSIEYDTVKYPFARQYVYLYDAGIDPYNYILGIETDSATGVKCRITAPQFDRELENMDQSISEIVTQDGEEYNHTITQRASLQKFEMTAVIETYGAGMTGIEGVTFWIRLYNNDFSVFAGADRTVISFINVYTIDVDIQQQAENLEFDPDGQGYDVEMHTADKDPVTSVPSWTEDFYNIDNLKALSEVYIPIRIYDADPEFKSLTDWKRVECQATITFGMDILVIGEWDTLKPYREVVPPEPDLTPEEELLLLLEAIAKALLLIGGIVVTFVILYRVPGRVYKILGLVITWAVIAYMEGWLDPLLQQLGFA
ncbi:MAG: hypothetical protein ACFFF4_09900 [Candidatus Thorarchaeota archaeon]